MKGQTLMEIAKEMNIPQSVITAAENTEIKPIGI